MRKCISTRRSRTISEHSQLLSADERKLRTMIDHLAALNVAIASLERLAIRIASRNG